MEYIIAVLLGIIAIAETHRTYLSMRPQTRKRHFEDRLRGTRATIWDLQFKVFKTREIREGIRRDYDQMKSRISTMEQQIKDWPADKDVGDRKRIEDDKVRAERDAERYVKQMQMLDVEVEGAKPTAENPQGHTGLTQQIDSLREVEKMVQDYLKDL